MKKCTLIYFLSTATVQAGLLFSLISAPVPVQSGEIVVSLSGGIPVSNVAESYDFNMSVVAVQSRNINPSNNWKGITQTFEWDNADGYCLDGVGFHLGDEQTAWTSNQQYMIVLQHISARQGTNLCVMLQQEFTLPASLMMPNQWLYIDFEEQEMIPGEWYGITLCPASNSVMSNIAYWDKAFSATEGAGGQFNFSTGGFPVSIFTSSSGGMAFYLQVTNTRPFKAEIVLSNTGSVPTNKIAETYSYDTDNNAIQTRNTNPASDWKAITQTIKWKGDQGAFLDGIGFHVGGEQPAWTNNQQYVLVIQELTARKGTATNTLLQEEFTLMPNRLVADQWLYIDFKNIEMVADHWYGITLCPSSNSVGSNVAFWDRAAMSTEGAGGQYNLASNGFPVDEYTTSQGGMAYYLKAADIPSSWVYAGNEKEDVVDSETGRTIRYLSSGDWIDTHFHYASVSWGVIGGNQYLFFSSSRERPEGAGFWYDGERPILAANAESGDLYYLTSIPNNAPVPTGHLSARPYFATYNDVSKSLYFFDKRRNRIYSYDCLTGAQKLLVILPEGAISNGIDDFSDEDTVRLLYSYTIDQPNGGTIGYIAAADFDRNLNFVTNTVIRECSTNEFLNHAEINPVDKNLFTYKVHTDESDEDGGALYLRNVTAGTDQVLADPNGLSISHMIWGKSGNAVFWCNGPTVGNLIGYWDANSYVLATNVYAQHNQLTSDENLWCYDHRASSAVYTQMVGNVEIRNWEGSIGIYNFTTGQDEKYANILWGSPHPRHAHPQFSIDNSMVSFVTAACVTNENTRVAVMDVDE